MTVSELAGETLFQFVKEYAGDRLKVELLAFWGRHPNARFSRLAIRCALECGKSDINRTLKDMVEAGLLDIHTGCGEVFYSLTADETKRQLALGLATLGWARWMSMVRQAESNSPSKSGSAEPANPTRK